MAEAKDMIHQFLTEEVEPYTCKIMIFVDMWMYLLYVAWWVTAWVWFFPNQMVFGWNMDLELVCCNISGAVIIAVGRGQCVSVFNTFRILID